MKIEIASLYKDEKDKIIQFLENFDNTGSQFGKAMRNKIKLYPLEGKTINIKSFKVPNAVNKIAYRFFRKSKAERSYFYARHLLKNEIGTPFPVAYAEETSAVAFKKSFYVSEHMEYDLTYRELVTQPDYPEHEKILRAFTRFTYELHEKKIEFLDHSPGNTLIKKNERAYNFYLVDLNRMNFREMSFEDRMKNFSRLTPKIEMVEIMADEYARLINKPKAEVVEKMWFFTTEFQEKFHRKKRFKRKIKFWKKDAE